MNQTIPSITQEFIYKKCEKITKALFAITQYFPDTEVLKNQLRGAALMNIEFLQSKGHLFYSNQERFNHMFHDKLLYTKSLLEIAEISGFISQMNKEVITEEFMKLSDISSETHERRLEARNLIETGEIQESEFNKVRATQPSSHVKFNQKRQSITSSQKKDIKYHVAQTEQSFSAEESKNKKIQQDIQQKTPTQSNKQYPTSLNMMQVKGGRREKILAIAKVKDTFSINDLISSIKGCSSKTLQRELIDLVEEGILLKSGERRWSVYALKDKVF